MINYIYLTETESTNKYTKELAKKGYPEFTVVIADKQSGGYGRMGRSFYSPESSGLYMSILLRPDIPADKALYITTAAAAAVSEAIEEVCGKVTGIKWVNDIFIDGKKVAGILTEAAFKQQGKLDYAILGIGVNVYSPDKGFPEELKDIAGSIYDHPADIRATLAGCITDKFIAYYRDLEAKEYLSYYREKSMVIGKEIKVLRATASYSAKAVSIDDEFRLTVQDDSGNITALDSGEISIRM